MRTHDDPGWYTNGMERIYGGNYIDPVLIAKKTLYDFLLQANLIAYTYFYSSDSTIVILLSR